MIVFVDLEHDLLRQHAVAYQRWLGKRQQIKDRLEEISGNRCLIVRYHRLAPAILYALQVRAVVISGHVTTMDHYAGEDLAGLCAVFREGVWPTLSFCGGCQLLAHTYGAPIGPMGPLAPYDPASRPECDNTLDVRQECGFLPVHIMHAHPLFEGLTSEPVFFQSHYWEVKAAPPGFRVCAESALCRVQAIVHDHAPLFGTQFHPEYYDEEHQDGRRILENFFKLAGLSRKEKAQIGRGAGASRLPHGMHAPQGAAIGFPQEKEYLMRHPLCNVQSGGGAGMPQVNAASITTPTTNGRAKPSHVHSATDEEKIATGVRMILEAIGEDPDREGLPDTAQRVARMYAEAFQGLHQDPRDYLTVCFDEEYDEMVLVKDVPFYSMCEYHLLPFHGKAHIGYLPCGKVLDLSKVARVVEAFARRPQVQERLTSQIADLLMTELDAHGVAVVMEATHTCMTMRGVKKPGSTAITSAMRGTFKTDQATRSEFMSLILRS